MSTITQPNHYRWSDLPAEEMTSAITRRYLTGDRVTVARFELKRDGVVPRHSHENEQVTCVVSGTLRIVFDGREVVVGPGEVLQIPGGVPHEVTVIDDAVVLDVFCPVRQDWIDGTDTYFKR
jgi:quercetin dioxygenase-like cupin family protein